MIARRCTVDLTTAADAEIKRICAEADITTADCFRYGLLLLGIYVDAQKTGKTMILQKSGWRYEREIITLPLFVGQQPPTEGNSQDEGTQP